VKKQELILLRGKKTYNFMIVGFSREDDYGEVYFTDDNRRTSVYRGSDVKEVIKLAKKESFSLRER
jgi:predicted membrane GTPase involved in stress response